MFEEFSNPERPARAPLPRSARYSGGMPFAEKQRVRSSQHMSGSTRLPALRRRRDFPEMERFDVGGRLVRLKCPESALVEGPLDLHQDPFLTPFNAPGTLRMVYFIHQIHYSPFRQRCIMAQWTLDQAHSEVKFKVKHLVVSTVTGQFRSIRGSVEAARPDFSDAKIRFEADVDSISTNNEQRDGHLKSADFFDAANHPKLTFVSTDITRKGEGVYQLIGDMTIRGTKKSVTLDVTYNGTVKGFEGEVAGFEMTGKLNRQDFGLRWNAMTEAGGVVVSDEVKLDVAVELKAAQVGQAKAA
jgi:polyisoprenoid-binding protein YceI